LSTRAANADGQDRAAARIEKPSGKWTDHFPSEGVRKLPFFELKCTGAIAPRLLQVQKISLRILEGEQKKIFTGRWRDQFT
jgi:hypothetical protein